MKKSYSFLVELMYNERRQPIRFREYGYGSIQPGEDFDCMIDNFPLPKGRRKIFKITYTIAKGGAFKLIRKAFSELCFRFSDERIPSPQGYFLNCLIKDSEWPAETRFNRKVEALTKKEADKIYKKKF